jgi:hypothetical protein
MVRGSSVEGVLNDGQESRPKEIQERSKGGIHQTVCNKGEGKGGRARGSAGKGERERHSGS